MKLNSKEARELLGNERPNQKNDRWIPLSARPISKYSRRFFCEKCRFFSDLLYVSEGLWYNKSAFSLAI